MKYLFLLIALSTSSMASELDMRDVDINTFINFISSELDKTIIVGAELESSITVFAEYETPEELEVLIQGIVTSAGYYYSESNDIIRISAIPIDKAANNTIDNQEVIKVAEDLPAISLIQEVFTLKNVSSDFVYNIISNAFTGADLINSPNSNSIIISATDTQLDNARLIIAELDTPVKQVVIEAVIAEISEEDYNAFGINLKIGSGDYFAQGFGTEIVSAGALATLNFVTNADITALVAMIDNSGTSNILSSPKISVIDREEGQILVGQNVPFISSIQQPPDGAQPVQSIERQDVGVQLRVTPTVLPNGSIKLDIYQEVSDVTDSTIASDIITNQRTMTSSMIIEDGESVYLGGLKSEVTIEADKRVPLLGDVPWLGRLFRSSGKKSTEKVLAVIITARVV